MSSSKMAYSSRSHLLLQEAITSCRAHLKSTYRLNGLRGQDQTRNFRLRLWSSYLSPDFQKAIKRQHRIIKHKYSGALSRVLKWDPPRPQYKIWWDLKHFARIEWRDTECSRRWANTDGLNGTVRDGSQCIHGRRESSIFKKKAAEDDLVSSWTWHKISSTPLDSFTRTEDGNPRVKISNDQLQKEDAKANMVPELDYRIDPITNRKIYRNFRENLDQHSSHRAVEIPVKPFKNDVSQTPKFEPSTGRNETATVRTNVESVEPENEYGNVKGSSYTHFREAIGSEAKDHTLKSPMSSKLDGNSSRQMDSVNNNFMNFDVDGTIQFERDSHCQHDKPIRKEPSCHDPLESDEASGDLRTKNIDERGLFAFNERSGTSGPIETASSLSSSPKEENSASLPQKNISERPRSSVSKKPPFENFDTDVVDLLHASDARAVSGKVKEHQAEEHQVEERQAEEHQVEEHQTKEHQVEEHQAKEHQVEEHQAKEHQVEEHQSESDTASTSKRSSSKPREPAQYKILVYDPTMQVVNLADATSTVVDPSSIPAPEVLLRLSNPAKFFPHFEPLQSQGYEIASGGGDVLIFRKARDADPNPPQTSSTSSTAAPSFSSPRRFVNPIDGMQCILEPATGNFASPTGFVNHDLPSEPPFISNIDVREEPVFRGRNGKEDLGDGPAGHESQKTGRKLLIGAAWVAACSYAVGVVSEFFKTGGTDGRGPIGF